MPIFDRMVIESVLDWLKSQNLLETAGVVTGIACVWLAAKNKIWTWPVAIVSVVIYIFIFFEARLYADMGLQFYFLITNIYGWYFWNKRSQEAAVEIRSATPKQLILAGFAALVLAGILGFLLKTQTDASFPFVDSFCTACSLIAQLFLARKIIENWLIWILVDLIYIGVYLAKDLDLTAGMYALYIYIAAAGYIGWRRELKLQNSKLVHGAEAD